jgi:hypothetical protein
MGFQDFRLRRAADFLFCFRAVFAKTALKQKLRFAGR